LSSKSEELEIELARIEKEILSDQETNRLLSMVMQAPIDEVLSGGRAGTLEAALAKSIELYGAISDAAAFLSGLIEKVLGRLK
jgi:hypothetical protein